MKIDSINTQINDLNDMMSNLLTYLEVEGQGKAFYRDFHKVQATSLSFIKRIFGEDHVYYKNFTNKVDSQRIDCMLAGLGILQAIKYEIENGWLYTTKDLVSAEIFSDFLEMAEHLLKESYKDAAAVMIGSTLEEHLRQLCLKNGILITTEKDGKEQPLKASVLNGSLSNASVYSKLDNKSVTAWLDLRNNAAHGKYDLYTKEQVELMLHGVLNFISRTTSIHS